MEISKHIIIKNNTVTLDVEIVLYGWYFESLHLINDWQYSWDKKHMQIKIKESTSSTSTIIAGASIKYLIDIVCSIKRKSNHMAYDNNIYHLHTNWILVQRQEKNPDKIQLHCLDQMIHLREKERDKNREKVSER